MTTDLRISNLISNGALFVVNDSGGKDSQAMKAFVRGIVPANQILVVHASLGEMEWKGALEHAQETSGSLPFVVAQSAKSLLDMVERRFESRPSAPSWPSASCRQCTSDLKRDPITKAIKTYAKANEFSIIVNCTGIRAAESTSRSKLDPFKTNNREHGKAGRQWFEWCPIFDWTVTQVWNAIREAGQEPHWAYKTGNERLSCVFCIMGSPRDLANGARHNPELLDKYKALEVKTGYTMHQSRRSLDDLIAEGMALLGLV